MTIVIVGCVADKLGHASQWVTVPDRGPIGLDGRPTRNFDARQKFFAVPSIEYRSVQPERVVVDVDHGRPIGDLKYLERNSRALYAVCEIDASTLGEGPWFFSPEIRHADGTSIELRGLAVTRTPASIGLDPITPFAGELWSAARQVVYQDGHAGQLVKRARDYDRSRKRGEPIVIQGEHPQLHKPEPEIVSTLRRLETRAAVAVDVHTVRREVDLVVAPAESPTDQVTHHGRQIVEVIAHGAFAGVETDPGRVKVNMHHRIEQVIGKAIAFNAWDEVGLTGTVRLARTRDASEALEMIDMGLLGVSAGFMVGPGGEQWRGNQRRIVKASLHHVALVTEPAYKHARVVAVRRSPSAVR